MVFSFFAVDGSAMTPGNPHLVVSANREAVRAIYCPSFPQIIPKKRLACPINTWDVERVK
jgi:hypothetical protein